MNSLLSRDTDEDVQIIKCMTLLPILRDMVARDMEELRGNKDKIIYNHLIYYLRDLEQLISAELQDMMRIMTKRDMRIVRTELKSRGIYVEYKARGYLHHYMMLRSLVKAELMTMLMKMRGNLN
ncbi:hypothetical protein [Paenibacillus aestuarii]|uniref:Uncharacterized protein n=1 Tax=Paenibacillus aestuarii TaxID=516965 RepID=A0ABW0KK17_9BACL|nr:hypothetical protein [Paenibacillus aestuarii]